MGRAPMRQRCRRVSVCREVTWACAQCPVARTGLLAADCNVEEHLLCDFGALLLLLCQRGAGDERQQRKADQKRVRRSHFSPEKCEMTWKRTRKKKHEELGRIQEVCVEKNVGRLDVASAPLPGCAGGLLCGLRTCAGVLLRGSVASKLQVGTRGVCHCVLCFRVFLL